MPQIIDDKYPDDGKIRLVNDGGIGAKTKLMVGNRVIPVYSAVVWIKPGDLVRIEAEIPLEYLDVEALPAGVKVTHKEGFDGIV